MVAVAQSLVCRPHLEKDWPGGGKDDIFLVLVASLQQQVSSPVQYLHKAVEDVVKGRWQVLVTVIFKALQAVATPEPSENSHMQIATSSSRREAAWCWRTTGGVWRLPTQPYLHGPGQAVRLALPSRMVLHKAVNIAKLQEADARRSI